MNLVTSSFLLLASLFHLCLGNNLKITNGKEAIPHSLPYQAFISVTGEQGNYFCGGSIVSNQYILSSATCLNGTYVAFVIVGAHNISAYEPTQQRLSSSKVIVHPKYDSVTLDNDAALIELPFSIEFNEYVQPIKLAKDGDVSYDGEICKLAGWGAEDPSNPKASPVLRYMQSQILDTVKCKQWYEYFNDDKICVSGEGHKSFCFGDFGSPLTVDDEQVGITSFTTVGLCGEGVQGFTRISSVINWIELYVAV